jgi:hypothetical protein
MLTVSCVELRRADFSTKKVERAYHHKQRKNMRVRARMLRDKYKNNFSR